MSTINLLKKVKCTYILFFCLINIFANEKHSKIGNNCLPFYQNPSKIIKLEEKKNDKKYIYNLISKYTSIYTDTLNIPVIFHVIHNNEMVGTGGNLSYEQILSQLEVLNREYNKPINILGRNFCINFCLAAYDNNNNMLNEPGVERVLLKSEWVSQYINGKPFIFPAPPLPIYEVPYFYIDVKPVTIWNPEKYLNIWTYRYLGNSEEQNTPMAFSSYPDSSIVNIINFENLQYPPVMEELYNIISYENPGILIQSNAIGTNYDENDIQNNNFELQTNYDKGTILVHEIGHYLSLVHVYGFKSFSTECEDNSDDFCFDTPKQKHANFICNFDTLLNSLCDNFIEETNIHFNYMDGYVDSNCKKYFTYSQKFRMILTLLSNPLRRKLISSTACSKCLINSTYIPSNCTSEYEPVCGCDGVEYYNSCIASTQVRYYYQCEDIPDTTSPPLEKLRTNNYLYNEINKIYNMNEHSFIYLLDLFGKISIINSSDEFYKLYTELQPSIYILNVINDNKIIKSIKFSKI
jgi:hypothetical protein